MVCEYRRCAILYVHETCYVLTILLMITSVGWNRNWYRLHSHLDTDRNPAAHKVVKA